jgi:ankyrin repeat protein
MKTKSLLTIIVLAAGVLARAQTNDLSAALQQGLFEEEANHNLDAAIQAYQSLASQFDKDRKLAATAVFRLGECYRKLGRTNEAAVQYQRVLNEFSDQTTLATLSRQDLAGLGQANAVAGEASLAGNPAGAGTTLDNLQSQFALLKAQLDQARKETNDEVVAKLFDDADLSQAASWFHRAQANLNTDRENSKAQGVQSNEAEWEKEVNTAKQRVEASRKRLFDYQELRLNILESAIQEARKGNQLSQGTGNREVSSVTDEEQQQIRRIQAMIQNSPDLINASDKNGETPLQKAAAKGQLEIVKFLLNNGAAVNAFGSGWPSFTALHYAAANGRKAVVDLLLSRGANVDARAQTSSGMTPLHLAASKGYELVAKTLLDAGASSAAKMNSAADFSNDDIQYRINPGSTPLEVAANQGFVNIFRLMLAHIPDVNAKEYGGATALHIAARLGDKDSVELLLAKDSDVNATNSSGETPLISAAANTKTAVVELLLSKGADVNTTNNQGRTALSFAAEKNDVATVRALLEAHADPNAGLDLPLNEAAYNGNVEILQLLLSDGANPNATKLNPQGVTKLRGENFATGNRTPLWFAVNLRHPEAVKLLIQFKADPNAFDSQSDPLIFVSLADPPTLKALLEGGADPNVRNREGETLLNKVIYNKNQAEFELLLAHVANVNSANIHGLTPLSVAASNGSTNIVELLLAKGADPNVFDDTGHTPLEWAKDLQRPDVAALLRQHGALDDLPRLDRIEVSRPSANFSQTILMRGTNDYNRFTLLELLAVQYHFLAGAPQDRRDTSDYSAPVFWSEFRKRPGQRVGQGRGQIDLPSTLPFPDLAHLRLRQPASDLKSWKEQMVDLSPILNSGECSKDVPLEGGDVVEIPEADHPLDEQWNGFPTAELANLKKCLTRHVEIIVKGQATTITLAPEITIESAPDSEPSIVPNTPFWIRQALLQSKLVLASSDLSRVKVTRRDPKTGKKLDWVLDCSNPDKAPDFWLRDGDVIEVPEK